MHEDAMTAKQKPRTFFSRGADFESILAIFDQNWPKTVENEQKRPKIDPEIDS